ncbi:hypothetical protein ACLKA6_018879 [Drosophila palustris]
MGASTLAADKVRVDAVTGNVSKTLALETLNNRLMPMETSKEPRVTSFKKLSLLSWWSNSTRNLLVGRPDMLPTTLVTFNGEKPSALILPGTQLVLIEGGRPLTHRELRPEDLIFTHGSEPLTSLQILHSLESGLRLAAKYDGRFSPQPGPKAVSNFENGFIDEVTNIFQSKNIDKKVPRCTGALLVMAM